MSRALLLLPLSQAWMTSNCSAIDALYAMKNKPRSAVAVRAIEGWTIRHAASHDAGHGANVIPGCSAIVDWRAAHGTGTDMPFLRVCPNS